jgi:uncharacterized YigZ family protein
MQTTTDIFKTIAKPSKGFYKEKGSKFFAFAYQVSSEEEAYEHIKSLKNEYYDARHHCYAFALGINREFFKASDDGEPSGTAGKPILNQIIVNDLSNILVVVIRYFGGVLLGTGGLVNAYRTAAADAIHQASIIEKTENALLSITFDYKVFNTVMHILKEENVEQLHQQFENDCNINISVRNSKIEYLTNKLMKIDSVKVHIV